MSNKALLISGLIGEAVCLAAATALIYAYAYFFEFAYLLYFRIPPDFIQLNIDLIIRDSLHLVFILMGIFMAFWIPTFWFSTEDYKACTRLVKFIIGLVLHLVTFALLLFITFRFFGISWETFYITALIFSVTSTLTLGINIFFKPNENEDNKKLATGHYFFLAILAFILIPTIAFWDGKNYAELKEISIINFSDKSYKLIRVYGDRAIVMPTKTSSGYYIFSLNKVLENGAMLNSTEDFFSSSKAKL